MRWERKGNGSDTCREEGVDGRESMNAGDVWVHRGGGEGCDVRRLGFWMERLVELGDM